MQLIAEAHWRTTSVEQAHGSVSAMHRRHKIHGVSMLAARSMVHMVQQILHVRVHNEAGLAKQEGKIDRLRHNSARKTIGRHVFFADFMSALKEQPDEDAGMVDQRVATKKHVPAWAVLSAAAKQAYEAMAIVRQHFSEQGAVDELQGVLGSSLLERKRLGDEAEKNGILLRLANSRLDEEHLERKSTMWERATSRRVVWAPRAKQG